ncbi:MAG: GAF domain-containing protein [Longimicrobiales bacterium]|jgi:GAF domain-containing protein
MTYPKPHDEVARLSVLNDLSILDTRPERPFDLITEMARDVFDVPMVAISLVAEHRQWFKSTVGLCASQTPREHAFCNYTITAEEDFEVLDATEDARFADNPLVTGAPHIAYYCGVPIMAKGRRLGALCILDRKTRAALNEVERRILNGMAEQVGREIESRRVLRQALATLATSMDPTLLQ